MLITYFVILCLEIGGKICIKPLAEDAEISKTVRVHGCWEPDNVRSVLLALKKFPTATLLGPSTIYILQLINKVFLGVLCQFLDFFHSNIRAHIHLGTFEPYKQKKN